LAISEHSLVKDTQRFIEELQMSLPQDSPANPSQSQESKQEKMIPATCGLPQSSAFVWYDHDMRSWRTSQACLIADISDEFSETWPKKGMMQDGQCWEQTMWEAHIKERGSGFTLPTPRANQAMSAKITENTANAKHPNLETVLAKLILPTVVASEYKGAGRKRYRGSEEYRGAKCSEGLRNCESDPIYLTPSFAEWMMGLPIMWTDLKPLGMDRFQVWWQQHGSY
jgi:hypothetical protein